MERNESDIDPAVIQCLNSQWKENAWQYSNREPTIRAWHSSIHHHPAEADRNFIPIPFHSLYGTVWKNYDHPRPVNKANTFHSNYISRSEPWHLLLLARPWFYSAARLNSTARGTKMRLYERTDRHLPGMAWQAGPGHPPQISNEWLVGAQNK